MLKGAAVEGPNGTVYRGFQTGMSNCPPDDSDPYAQFNSKAKFKDDIESFSTVEPAVDLTATSPLAFARLAAGLRLGGTMRRSVPVVAALVVAAFAGGAGPAPGGAVADGRHDPVRRRLADQYGALALLNAHGMHATFYVNSGPIGDADHMSWAQLGDLAAAGNEIAGHTVTHANVKKLKTGPSAPGGLRRPGGAVRPWLPARLVRVPVRRRSTPTRRPSSPPAGTTAAAACPA